MDLRITKTLTNIGEAFYNLCNKKTIEKIRVKDIILEAKINKTTFYRYYKNIDQLTEELETEEINRILDASIDYQLFFHSPATFFNLLVKKLVSSNKLHFFYNENRTFILTEKLCQNICYRISLHEPTIKNEEDTQYILNFFVSGIIHSQFTIFQNPSESSIERKLEECYKLHQILETPILKTLKYKKL